MFGRAGWPLRPRLPSAAIFSRRCMVRGRWRAGPARRSFGGRNPGRSALPGPTPIGERAAAGA
eukprot:3360569-Alexandrium_andersonii.AAC.1